MVHKFKNKVDSYLFSEMPVDSMDYERKGGCFVSISKGAILTILFVIFGFILGLIVFYTTKHVYQNSASISLEEFIKEYEVTSDDLVQNEIIPKHYRLIFNPLLNDSQNPFSFNGNVWITITPNQDDIKSIELDVTDLVIRKEDVFVYRSRTLSNSDFEDYNRGKRSAKIIEDDISSEEYESDILFNSTESIDLNATTIIVEKESQEATEGTEENSTTELNESINSNITEILEVSSVTENIDYSNISVAWDHLMPNDTMLMESNSDDYTELKIDDLQFDFKRKKLLIKLNVELRKGHYYVVKIFFRGKMTNNYGLVYKSSGTDVNDNFVAATITGSHHTPSVFPCINNARNEVAFTLNLIHRSDHQSISISKLVKTERITNDWTLDIYQRTLPIKLKYFGFVITNIEPIIVTATPNLLLHSYVRSTILPSITFIDSEIPKMITKFEAYTNVTHPMDFISFVGVPNSINDIMELKYGLMIASESFFITNGDGNKSSKAAEMSNQIGKLWFQPWETNQFMDMEWINECLPLQLKLISVTDGLKNDYALDSSIERNMESMRKEQSSIGFTLGEFSLHSSDKNWIDIGQSKGLFLLEILRNFVTDPIYQLAVQRFFKSNASINFLHILNNMTIDGNISHSFSMNDIVQEWSTQPNYPIMNIQKNSNHFLIQQREFGDSISTRFWISPIAIGDHTFWLKNNSMIFDVEDNNWLTVQSNGYFRVNYDENHWNAIINALAMDHKSISTKYRAILIDDAFNLAKFGYLNYSITVKLLECWNNREMEYLPWRAVFDNLAFVYRNSIDHPMNSSFNILLTNLTQRIYQNIVRSPLGGIPYKFKVLIKNWSCGIFSLPACLADNKRDFHNLIYNGTLKRSQRTPADIEQFYCSVLRLGDQEHWQLVRDNIHENNSFDYNKALIYSLGCSPNLRSLNLYFQLLLDKNYNDYAETILKSMSDNSLGQKYALEFIYINFQQLYAIHGIHTLKTLLRSIATQYDFELLQLFFIKNSSIFNAKDVIHLAESVRTIKNTLKWKNKFGGMLIT